MSGQDLVPIFLTRLWKYASIWNRRKSKSRSRKWKRYKISKPEGGEGADLHRLSASPNMAVLAMIRARCIEPEHE